MANRINNTLLFFVMLLFGGIVYLHTQTGISVVDTFMFSVNFMIYIGLLIGWMVSVRDRLLPPKRGAISSHRRC